MDERRFADKTSTHISKSYIISVATCKKTQVDQKLKIHHIQRKKSGEVFFPGPATCHLQFSYSSFFGLY